MSLDTSQLTTDMINAIKGVLSDKWPKIKEYGETESKKLAESFAMIEKLKLKNEIDDEEARLQFKIQKNASRTVQLTNEGLGVLAAEEAINAAMKVVKDTVNSALGFTLIK
jgi:hypothetical protein